MKKTVRIKLLKSINLFLISLLLISCNSSDKKNYSEKIKETNKLKFYKCDYSNKFDTLLSSGSKNTIDEIWGFNIKYKSSQPHKDLKNIDLNRIIGNANQYLSKKFPEMKLSFDNLTLEKINKKEMLTLNNSFFIVSFLYDKKGYYQQVPVLADGRIILSSNE